MNVSKTRLGAIAVALSLAVSAGMPLAQAAHPRAQVTLTMWAWADRNLCPKEYMKEHPEIKVIYTESFDARSRLLVLKRAGVAGGAGWIDVWFDGIETALNDARLGLAAPLDDVMPPSVREKYAPNSIDQLVYKGHMIAAPNDMAVYGIWYNPEVMKKAGLTLPKSHQDIFRDAAKLAKTHQYYISTNGPADSTMLEEMAWASEAKWFTPNSDGSWHVNINTPLTVKLATDYVKAVKSGGILPDGPFSPISGKAFGSGKVAYALGPNWLGHYMIEPTYPQQKGKWSFAASLPSAGWWGGAVYMATPQSRHLAEAKKLAVYCSTSPAFQKQTGTLPSYTGVWNVAGALRPDPYWANPAETAAQLRLSGAHSGKNWFFSPNAVYVDKQVGVHMTSIYNGANPASEIAKLQQEVIDNLKLINVAVK